MDRLVVYSLVLPEDEPRPDLLEQFCASVETLRRHNQDVDVVLFSWGRLARELTDACRRQRVMVHQQGSYEERLARLAPTGWRALARYPLLHRFLNFAELSQVNPRQVLVCDCDTIFFADVARLFDAYDHAHVVAREEVGSRRSHHGADASFIDEQLLASLARHERCAMIPPFNLGVILMNHQVWRQLALLEERFVDYAWRFVAGMARADLPASEFGQFRGLDEARRHADAHDLARALPYPSSNHWILDEVSLWLTLGHVQGIRTADFSARDVAQNGEFSAATARSADWVVCHYYSQNTERIRHWLSHSFENEAPRML